jgi:hypothetical protein
MGIPDQPDQARDHRWSQQHLSHYVEGDLRPRARRRLARHALGCVDCGRGIRAMRALVYAAAGIAAAGIDGRAVISAPAAIFDRARQAGTSGPAAQPGP